MKVIPPRKISAATSPVAITNDLIMGDEDLIPIERGMVLRIVSQEYLCTGGDEQSILRKDLNEKITLLGNKTKASRVIRRISEDDVEKFLSGELSPRKILSSGDDEQTKINQKQNTDMAKKKTTETNGKPGKIEFIESLLDGKLTKAEIAAKLVKEYGISEQTAKNTVNWTCSTFGTRNAGKEAKYKEVERAAKADKKPAVKKSSAKKPAAKKTVPKRKPAASKTAVVSTTETVASAE